MAELPDFARAHEAIEYCYSQDLTDGLPVVPPTVEAVESMLRTSPYPGDHVIGEVPPRNGIATVQVVAANAVMAGCRPDYFPVVVAAVEAVLTPAFNLNGVQATTHNCSPLLIVSGPVTEELGFNSSAGCFGSGTRANASVGRAVRLLMVNAGGAAPGATDQSTFGHPGKFSYCIAERAERNPWETFATARGVADANTVTVLAAEAPHLVNDHTNRSPHRIGSSIASTLTTLGSNNTWFKGECLVVVGPGHAATFAEHGWTRRDLQHYLFDKARHSIAELRKGGRWSEETFAYWPHWIDVTDDQDRLPLVCEPDDILVVVAGGDSGLFSMVAPGWGDFGTRAVTRPVAWSTQQRT